MFCISDLSPDALIIIGVLLAVLLTQNLNVDQLNVLGNFLAEVAAAISTKAAQMQSLETKADLMKQIADMETQLCKLKEQVR